MNVKNKKIQVILFFIVVSNFFFSMIMGVHAQFQENNFSGSDISNYQCLNSSGVIDPSISPYYDSTSGLILCPGGEQAILKPPKLQQLEIWFIRIVFAIWALVTSLSFLLLFKLGFDYMISRGDPTQITVIRKRIVNYIIGVALCFLSIPILTTIFNLLSINDEVDCYDEIAMPGFQFFFANTCTASSAEVASNCGVPGFNLNDACSPNGARVDCTSGQIPITYICTGNKWVGI